MDTYKKDFKMIIKEYTGYLDVSDKADIKRKKVNKEVEKDASKQEKDAKKKE